MWKIQQNNPNKAKRKPKSLIEITEEKKPGECWENQFLTRLKFIIFGHISHHYLVFCRDLFGYLIYVIITNLLHQNHRHVSTQEWKKIKQLNPKERNNENQCPKFRNVYNVITIKSTSWSIIPRLLLLIIKSTQRR